jgi:bacteriophage N4 adsorption protein A
MDGPSFQRSGWLALMLLGNMGTAAADAPAAQASLPAAAGVIDRFMGEVARFRAYPHFDRAYALLRAGRDKDAAVAFETGLKHEPGNTAARLALVDALTRLGRRDQALRQASQALQAEAGHPGALRRRGVLLFDAGRTEEALADLRSLMAHPGATAEDRDVAKGLLARASAAITGERIATPRLVLETPAWMDLVRSAEAHESQGRYLEAVADYRQAMKLTSDPGSRLNILGAQARIARQQNDQALLRSCLLQAIGLAPRNVVVLRDLVALAQRSGDAAQAQRWMSQLSRQSRSAGDFEYVANLQFSAGQASAAADGYRQALAHTRDAGARHRLFMALGHALSALEDQAAAAAAFRNAASQRATPDALRALVEALHRSGDRTAAVEALKTLVQRHPGPANRLRLAALLGEDERDADAVEQVQLALAAATDNPTRLQAQRRLVLLHSRQGDPAAVRTALTEVVRLAPDDNRSRLALAQACAELGDLAAAAGHYEISVRLRASLQAYRGLVGARTRMGDVPGSVSAYKGLLTQADLDPADAAKAQASLADLLMTQGDPAGAAQAYRAALDGGLNPPSLHLGLGYALAGLQRSQDALAQFQLAYQAEPSSGVALQLARTHMALGQSDPAMLYGQAALADTTALTPDQHQVLLQEMGNLHSALGQTRQAAAMWESALALSPWPQTALALARAQLADQRTQAAERTLAAWPADAGTPSLTAEHLDLGSRIKQRQKRTAEARALLARAEQIDPSIDRQYRLALLDMELGQTRAGLASLDRLMRGHPQGRYREAAAQVLYDGGRFGPAAALFGKAVEDEPERIDLRRSQAYALMRDGQNEPAAEAFGQAITVARLQADAHELDVWRMRQEVTKLNKRFDFSVYESYRSNTGAAAAGGSGVVPSQGGAEAAWRPPGIGLVDDRTLHLFGRITWSHRPDSLAIDHSSTQGSIGLRYKPLGSQQLYVGAERLLKIGSATRGDWLLRASYGWTDGLGVADPRSTSWNYSSFYADIGRFTGQRLSAAYVEARQGRTWKIGETLLLSPHLVFDGRWQRPDNDRSSYSEAGAGVSLRSHFNGSDREAPRSSLELLLQYKHGIKRVGNGWSVTAILAF